MARERGKPIEIVRVQKPQTDAQHPYMIVSTDSVDYAMRDLKGARLVIWLYLARHLNTVGSSWMLRPSVVGEETCVKSRDTINDSIDELIEKGYLVPDGSGQYEFREKPFAF